MSALGLLGTAGVWILVAQAKQMGYEFVAKAPAVVSAAETAEQANKTSDDQKVDMTLVKQDLAGVKLDAAVMSQKFDRVFSALTDLNNSQQAVLVSLAGLAPQMTDMKERMIRVESKQDAAPR